MLPGGNVTQWFFSWAGHLPHVPVPFWLASILISLIFGLLLGVFLKHGVKIVIIFVVLVIIAFVTGVASPSLLSTVFSLGYSNVKVLINDFSVLVPFEGLFFFIGLALGFLKA